MAERLFPDMTQHGRGRHAYDREGWTLGTHTADLAALTAILSIADDRARMPEPLFPVPHHV
jgi:hypothetical protein